MAATKPKPAENPFVGLPRPPSRAQLEDVLGPSAALFARAEEDLCSAFALDGAEWNAFSKNSGWNLRLKKDGRNIVYLVPRRGFFLASFALGQGAVQQAKDSGLPAKVLELLVKAKKYAEGTALAVPVRKAQDLSAVKKLVAAKLAN